MSKKAIDIVLLPPENIMKLCIDLNRKDNADSYQTINLKDNLPHISLAMGVLDENDLESAKNLLSKISNDFLVLNLELFEMYYGVTPDNKKSYAFRVGITEELQNLHNKIVSDFSKILSHNKVSIDMFYFDPNETMDEISSYWVQNYPKKSFENFSAHISLKCRNAEYNNTPVKFTANDLAICYLGNFCTCRKILHSVKLKSKLNP